MFTSVDAPDTFVDRQGSPATDSVAKAQQCGILVHGYWSNESGTTTEASDGVHRYGDTKRVAVPPRGSAYFGNIIPILKLIN